MNSNQKHSSIHQNWFRWLLFLGGWLIIGTLIVGAFYLTDLFKESPRPVILILTRGLLPIYLCGFLAPPVIILSRKFPLDKENWKSRIWLHLIAAFVFSITHYFLLDIIFRNVMQQFMFFPRGFAIPPRLPFSESPGFGLNLQLIFFFLRNINLAFFIYWVIAVASHAFGYYKKFQERELQTSKLEAQLAKEQLQLLRNQLQPHFLFNTLHTLSSLIYEDVKAADKMIRQLSELLRKTLDHSDEQEITLNQEIEQLGYYLEIMKTRFQNRLFVEMRIPGEVKNAMIPNLILQPLVENAIKHGLEQSTEIGKINITAIKVDEKILIEIEDNGPGLNAKNNENQTQGIGLVNTRKRLDQLYGNEYKFELKNVESGGLKVTLEIPFHTNPF